MNQRNRERVAVAIVGNGVVQETGESFSFEAVDFSIMGMQVRVDKAHPAEGQLVDLDFQVDTPEQEQTSIALTGQVMRLTTDEQGILCGIKWVGEEAPEKFEALEAFYVERFFDALG